MLVGSGRRLDLAVVFNPRHLQTAAEYAEERADERGWPWANVPMWEASLARSQVDHVGPGLLFAVSRAVAAGSASAAGEAPQEAKPAAVGMPPPPAIGGCPMAEVAPRPGSSAGSISCPMDGGSDSDCRVMLSTAAEEVAAVIEALVDGTLASGVRATGAEPEMEHTPPAKVLRSMTASSLSWAGRLGRWYEAALFSADECARLIAAAERHGCWQLRGEYEGTATRDVDVTTIGQVWPWLEGCARQAWQPLLMSLYGVDVVVLKTLRIVKYVASQERARGIGLHSDGSELSFVCTLSNGFEGGGTYVRALSRVLSPPRGSAALFCGRWVHSGVDVTRGERYVLTAFFSAASSAASPAAASPAHTFAAAAASSASFASAVRRIRQREELASVSPRLCPGRRHLGRRCRLTDEGGEGGERQGSSLLCTRCGDAVARGGVLHCCTAVAAKEEAAQAGEAAGCSCNGSGARTAWCDACLGEAQLRDEWRPLDAEGTAVAAEAGDSAEEGACEFVDDVTLPDGASVAAGCTATKIWRLRLRLVPSSVAVGACSVRLVRDDIDSDERVGSRCLGDGAFTWLGEELGEEHGSDGARSVQAAVEITAPTALGPYRVFFRVVSIMAGKWQPMGDRLWVDFEAV